MGGYRTDLTMDQLCEHMKTAARMIAKQSGRGALHIFVEDGNCEDEHLEFCLEQSKLTPDERNFLNFMLEEIGEEARAGAWALAQCTDVLDRSEGEG